MLNDQIIIHYNYLIFYYGIQNLLLRTLIMQNFPLSMLVQQTESFLTKDSKSCFCFFPG